MVILKLTKSVPDEFECEPVDSKDGQYRYIRPCERYEELYKSCRSIRSRVHQYYVYGELLDCKPHKENHTACREFRKTKDLKLLDRIIEWEKKLIHTRLMTVEQNKTWQMRESPPDDFESPLPDHIAKRQKSSLFNK